MALTAPPAPPDLSAATEIGSDYLATEAHYLSLAGRIMTAFRDGGGFVLVVGDPGADPQLLSEALRKVAEGRRAVIAVPCGSGLSMDDVLQAGSVVAALPTAGDIPAAPGTAEPGAPLYLFEEFDRLPDPEIDKVCATTLLGGRRGSAGVLLAGTSFLTRLEEPSLQLLKKALAAQFRFEELGQGEALDFLRHQLAVRHSRNESRSSIWPSALRGLGIVGALLTAGIGGFLLLQYIDFSGEPTARSATATSPTKGASAPSSTARQTTREAPERAAKADAPSPVPSITAPPVAPVSPQAALPAARVLPVTPPTVAPPAAPVAPPAAAPSARVVPVMPPAAAPSTAQNSAGQEAASRAPSTPPTQVPAGQRFARADLVPLLARGDDFLKAGDIVSARLFYERAADAGDGAAALRLGASFDPEFLARAGIRGTSGDPAQALSWYRRARELGAAAAAERLKTLDQRPPAAPASPSR